MHYMFPDLLFLSHCSLEGLNHIVLVAKLVSTCRVKNQPLKTHVVRTCMTFNINSFPFFSETESNLYNETL